MPNDLQLDLVTIPTEGTASHRRRSIRVLFVHGDTKVVDNCLQELKKGLFTVTADVVLNLTGCMQQLRSQTYDVVLAEYPSRNWEDSQALQLLHQTVQETPVLFVTTIPGGKSLAELAGHGAFDYVEQEHMAHLPMAVRRAVNEKNLRAELEQAEKALQHSQSRYRALVENPAYGICRCDAEGKFLEVNQALLTMLGYSTKEELLAADGTSEIVLDLKQGKAIAWKLARVSPNRVSGNRVEAKEWHHSESQAQRPRCLQRPWRFCWLRNHCCRHYRTARS